MFLRLKNIFMNFFYSILLASTQHAFPTKIFLCNFSFLLIKSVFQEYCIYIYIMHPEHSGPHLSTSPTNPLSPLSHLPSLSLTSPFLIPLLLHLFPQLLSSPYCSFPSHHSLQISFSYSGLFILSYNPLHLTRAFCGSMG